jgi:hypothetical protein
MTRYDARSLPASDRRPHFRHGRGTPVNQAEARPEAEPSGENEAHGGDVVGLALSGTRYVTETRHARRLTPPDLQVDYALRSFQGAEGQP